MKKILMLLAVGMGIALGLVYMSPAWADLSGVSRAPSSSGEKGTAKTLKDLPQPVREAVSAALGKDDPSYHISRGSEGFQAGNGAQKLAVAFSQGMVQVRSGDSLWKLKLEGMGYGEDLHLHPAQAVKKGNRLEYVRGPLTEWYINGPLGLEQGFTVFSRPSGQGNTPLTIGLSMEGDLRASVDGDKQGLWLCRQDGTKVLRYGGLRANDAAGKELSSWLEIKGSQLFLRVKEAGAIYPIVIDPLLQQAELTASDGAVWDVFGYSVSLSSDGNTALIGAYGRTIGGKEYQGAAYVFTRSGTTWSQQQELTASDVEANDGFGFSVSLSSDGNTALIGAYGITSGGKQIRRAAYVFTRSGTTWSQQQELSASDGEANDGFGFSVSLSSDGNTALIGVPYKTIGGNQRQGAAYVFTRSGTTWSQQQELTASDGAAGDCFGYSVSLSSDGNTALIGAPYKTIGGKQYQGAVYVFIRSGTTWSQQQELTASDGETGDFFGTSVSLNSDGNTALIGADSKNIGTKSGQGAVYVFTRSPTNWSQQQELTTSEGETEDRFGTSVSLSSDGNTALIGAPYKTWGKQPQGAAYVFTRSGTTWSQQEELTASDGATYDFFGYSVSLSSDGNTALIGAYRKDIGGKSNQGAAYSFKAQISRQGDYDEDGKKDISIWRPGTGMWYILRLSDGGMTSRQWGSGNDVPVQGDYDGDGKNDIAVWRPSNGYWYILRSSDGGMTARQWGSGDDVPVPGDYDGDWKTDIGIWRPSTGYWYILRSSDGGVTATQWGSGNDVPVPGDYDGDGKTDIGIWRPSTGYWYILRSSDGGVTATQWGSGNDVPVPGDYDGDGKADIAIWWPGIGHWYILRSSDGGMTVQQWGSVFDVPVPGDYDGDGKNDIAVWRPSNGYWYIIRSSDGGVTSRQWGSGNDVPLTR